MSRAIADKQQPSQSTAQTRTPASIRLHNLFVYLSNLLSLAALYHIISSQMPPTNIPTPASPDDDAFVNIWFGKEGEQQQPPNSQDGFYGQWSDAASARFSYQPVIGANALLKLYPKHSLVMTQDYQLDILSFPSVSATPMEKTPLLTNLVFVPLPKTSSPVPGVLIDSVQLGAFKLGWKDHEFLLFSVVYPLPYGITRHQFILHEGPEDHIRYFLMAVGLWADGLHDQIWVFNQGFWSKDHGLWAEAQKADWKDVILKDEFKKALQKDVYGFFSSEKVYKDLGIPWKRGLIMYGPPGNGKTISLKTIIKTCGEKGFAPLYVKSFQSWKGEEGAMLDVFSKARQVAPCVVILEDLDSLINDRNRSFFLNQMDGLEGNDGLLVIGTTNHFDRLDPGLSTRPSRFDRKYKFNDPDLDERKLYVQYWQNKLKDNNEIAFPDRLVKEIADMTDKFSFAYLKEAFVSALVTLAGYEGDDKPTFESLVKSQIKTLRKQLDKSNLIGTRDHHQGGDSRIRDWDTWDANRGHGGPRHSRDDSAAENSAFWLRGHHHHHRSVYSTGGGRAPRGRYSASVYDQADTDELARQYSRIGIQPVGARMYDTSQSQYSMASPVDGEHDDRGHNFRVMLDRLSARTGRDLSRQRIYTADNIARGVDGIHPRMNEFGMSRSP